MYEETIEAFLNDLQGLSEQSPERLAILRSMVVRLVNLAEVDTDLGDLRVAATALDELLGASTMFSKWRDHPKLAVFGSARTTAENPLFEMARVLSHEMALRGWMTVSGAGPGIMEASAKGAGKKMTLGVNIELPFEQFANPYIDAETMLVAMQYFFTRKVAMTRPSNAFAIFPGGFGTMDEAFEVLTLLHTGKTTPAPVVLIDTPEGTFWHEWLDFVTSALVAGDYIGENDMSLARICSSVDEAVGEIELFYSNYRTFSVENGQARVRLRHAPSADQVSELTELIPSFGRGQDYALEDAQTLIFGFDGRNFVNLRRLIDIVNQWTC
ncbi:MAG: TIGR00730 family Rossman fold protein [Acidimicrobiaceae bacterium]|nr:TIGR00730 family Rossman fold protein [Acidimicrobiaceae bacterium]